MHLVVDGIGARVGGAATSLTEILKVALSDPRATKIMVFCTPRSRRVFELPASEKIRHIEKPWVDQNYVLRILWYEFFLALSSR